MKRRLTGILLVLMTCFPAAAQTDSAGVVVGMQGGAEFEYLGTTGKVTPGMEVAAGTVFNGSLGDRVELATREGLQVIGSFPYTLNAPVLTDTELAGYLNVIGGSAVRTRGNAVCQDGAIGWPPNLMDQTLAENGFSLRFDVEGTPGMRMNVDSMTIPVPAPGGIISIDYRALAAPYSPKDGAEEDWKVLGEGSLEKDDVAWTWGFPEYRTDSPTGGRWINRVEFSVGYGDGTSGEFIFEYRIPDPALTAWVRSKAEAAEAGAATVFSGRMMYASELWTRGYSLEALMIMDTIGLKAARDDD